MPTCHRCQREYRGEEPYCDPCDEFKEQLRREMSESEAVVCQHCGGTFGGNWDQHRFSVYRRTGDFPQGRRTKLR